jgi:hypothetical protein
MRRPAPTRDELVERLAWVSRRPWMRQRERDQGVARDELDPAATDHDRGRAEHLVAELERLGLVRFPPA